MWAVKWVLSRDPSLRNGGVKGAFDYDPSSEDDNDRREVESKLAATTISTSTTATRSEVGGSDSSPSSSLRPPPSPKLYYVPSSAHLTQSDFNLLFPFFFRSKVPDPQGVMNYNIRAITQWLREAGYQNDLAGEPDGEIFGGDSEQEVQEEQEIIKGGWVRLPLAEEKIGKGKVEKAVEEGLGADGEGDLVEGGSEGNGVESNGSSGDEGKK